MVSFTHISERRLRRMPKTKKEWRNFILKTLLIILGTFLMTFGNVAFLVPLNINSGGLNGVAIIIRLFVPENMKVFTYNLVTDIAAVVLWIVGLLFIGKEFALKTLVATIVYPIANWLFTACPAISDSIAYFGELVRTAGSGPTAGNFILAAIFSGVFVGIGVSITFIGGGSTGGVDVLTFLFEKYLKIRQSIASFLIDGTIVTVGLIIMLSSDNSTLLPCLCGIISAFITSLAIEIIYNGSQSSYQVDIISSKWEEISNYAQNVLGRGTTIIHANGGYHGDERIILRIVFDRRQYNLIRTYISKVDPKAFVTFTRTNAVFGEGFKSHVVTNAFTKKDEKKNDK